MAFVGSLSSSLGTTIIAVTGSLVPGTNNVNDLGTSDVKWRTVFSNNITGSLTRLAGGGEYLKPGSNVTLTTGSDGSVTIAAAGGGASSFFTEDSLNKIFTTGSVAIGFAAAASTKGSDVFFAVSGSNSAINTATFSGPVVASGSLTIKDALTNNPMASISDSGVISGSALQSLGNLSVQGTSALIGNVTVTGNVAVNGGDITTSAGTFNIAASTATTVNIGSAATKVVVPGDFEVQGTTITANVSNITIEDPLIGLGFTSGSVASAAGDRGFIGGIDGIGNNVAWAWSDSNSAFVATRTTSTSGSITVTVSGLQPIRASKFQVSGSTAEVKGNGSTLQLSGTQLDVFAGNKGILLYRDNTFYGDLTGQSSAYNSSNGLRLQAADNTVAAISGSAVWLNGDEGRVYVGRNTAGAPNSGLLVSVNPGGGGGAGGFVEFIAKQGEGPSAVALPMTLTGSTLTLSVTNATTGVSVRDSGTEFATINKDGSSAVFKGTSDLILSGVNATVQTSAGNITLRTAQATQVVNYNIGATTYANVASASYAGGGADAIALNNVAKLSATNDLVLAGGSVSSVVVSGSNNLHLNFGQAINFQNAGTGYLQVVSSSYTSGGGAAGNVVKLEGKNNNGILLSPFTGKKVHLSGSIELGGGADNTVNFLGYVSSSIIPSADVSFTLGSPTARWQHIYTGDLHLRNERGDYTLIEESDFLSIRFNKNGKRYKFLLERVPELDER